MTRSTTSLSVALALVVALCLTARSAALDALPPDLAAALQQLPKSDETARQKTYALIAEKGDARLIPLLKAYKDGGLLLRGDRLELYGERVPAAGGGTLVPLLDALTGEPIKGADGKPIQLPKPDLSKAIKSPPRSERPAILDLISSLSLLDPDPGIRRRSIREAGERAGRAFVDPTEQVAVADALRRLRAALPADRTNTTAATSIDAALSEKSANPVTPLPSDATISKIAPALRKLQDDLKAGTAAGHLPSLVTATLTTLNNYRDRLDAQQKVLSDLSKDSTGLQRQLDKEPNGHFATSLREALASIRLVTGDAATQQAAAGELGSIGTSRAANLLRKYLDAARRHGDARAAAVAQQASARAERHQSFVSLLQNTFAGASLGSILVLLALGLSIVFGLMGVINMAHGEFMMVGAFTTYVVSEFFKHHLSPGAYDYYLLAAVPAAFGVAGGIGWACEVLVIRHLYGRTVDTLVATIGIGFILVQTARALFGDNLSVSPPKWMEGGVEVVPDLVFPLNRVYIIAYCLICISVVYFIVNRTNLGLLLRATTQNRQMAAALGVPTRRVDALTFAFGCGLAGLAGVAVPLYNKINPSIGNEYIVDSFMVVVVGGVGKLAGAIVAGFGLGFTGKYLEPILQKFPALASGASVIGKVLVLGAVVAFLQWRPQGLFPPKGRAADA